MDPHVLISTLKEIAEAKKIPLTPKSFENLALHELNFSVRDFWNNYKIYLVGAYGKSPCHLKDFLATQMGNISTAYGTFLGIEVNFEAVVRDVLMYMEMFFEAEYGSDIKNLGTLMNRFEDESEFSKGECGRIVAEIIQGEVDGKETLILITFLMNDDVIMMERIESLPVMEPCSSHEPTEPCSSHEPTEPCSSYEPTEVTPLNPAHRDVLLKERAKKLGGLRNQAKPVKDSEGKWVVETTAFGRPNGKGYRELLNFLSSKIREIFPLGGHRETVAVKTLELIVESARKEFSGGWSTAWAFEKMHATLRNKKTRIMKIAKEKNSRVGKDQNEVKRMMRDEKFLMRCKRLEKAREHIKCRAHAGRGGVVQIRHRYRQEHDNIDPTDREVEELVMCAAEKKINIE